LNVHLTLIITYFDERLQMRELKTNFKIPPEYDLWAPTLAINGELLIHSSAYLDPENGFISLIYKIKYEQKVCIVPTWAYPFDRYTCYVSIEAEDDEHLSIKGQRDMRESNNENANYYDIKTVEWPNLEFEIKFNNFWQSSITIIYLPSILIFSLAVFSQLKRRKVQVQVLSTCIICILLLLCSKFLMSELKNIITLQDLWLGVTFSHLIALLSVDLLLPSQHTLIDSNEEEDQEKTYEPKINSTSFNLAFHGSKEVPTSSSSQVYLNRNIPNGENELRKAFNCSSYQNQSYECSPLPKHIRPEAYPLISSTSLNHSPLSPYREHVVRKVSASGTTITTPSIGKGLMIHQNGHTQVLSTDGDDNKSSCYDISGIKGANTNYSKKGPVSKKVNKFVYSMSRRKRFGVSVVILAYILFAILYILIILSVTNS
uniref:Neur_chan_LBD domain-containing protein n=1 Tax=Rhabditophanes sp. KR3021 TaxID=114890 RepID=A0AC35TZ05_9BILA